MAHPPIEKSEPTTLTWVIANPKLAAEEIECLRKVVGMAKEFSRANDLWEDGKLSVDTLTWAEINLLNAIEEFIGWEKSK